MEHNQIEIAGQVFGGSIAKILGETKERKDHRDLESCLSARTAAYGSYLILKATDLTYGSRSLCQSENSPRGFDLRATRQESIL